MQLCQLPPGFLDTLIPLDALSFGTSPSEPYEYHRLIGKLYSLVRHVLFPLGLPEIIRTFVLYL